MIFDEISNLNEIYKPIKKSVINIKKKSQNMSAMEHLIIRFDLFLRETSSWREKT